MVAPFGLRLLLRMYACHSRQSNNFVYDSPVANLSGPPLDSVHRALQLAIHLRSVDKLSVTEAAEILGVVPSTAHRLLVALCYDGFAEQGSDRMYRKGPTLGDGRDTASLSELRTITHPVLEALNEKLNETVQAWVLENVRVRYVDGVESNQSLSVRTGHWDNVPAYCSAGGKSLLAQMNTSDLESLHRRGLPPWRDSPITTIPALKRHLAAVRRNGYALNLEESAQGINGLALSTHPAVSSPAVAISVAIPSSRFKRQDIPRYTGVLRQAVEDLEGALTTAKPRTPQAQY
jgi:DNA-binding IclR family transcriptional regulator